MSTVCTNTLTHTHTQPGARISVHLGRILPLTLILTTPPVQIWDLGVQIPAQLLVVPIPAQHLKDLIPVQHLVVLIPTQHFIMVLIPAQHLKVLIPDQRLMILIPARRNKKDMTPLIRNKISCMCSLLLSR